MGGAETYGALLFVIGLTGREMASSTLRGAGRSLIAEMRRCGDQNLCAELRSHTSLETELTKLLLKAK